MSGTSPRAEPESAKTRPAIPAARRAVSEDSFTMSAMFTLAATITRPARAAVAPTSATLNSDQPSSASMAGCYRSRRDACRARHPVVRKMVRRAWHPPAQCRRQLATGPGRSNVALIVQKYGGSSVADAESIKRVAKRIVDTRRAGHEVVVAVSAMGDTTDELLELANEVAPIPAPRDLDLLLSNIGRAQCRERMCQYV